MDRRSIGLLGPDLIFGTLPKICFAGGMTSFLFERKIRIFDYRKFAEPFRNGLRENAERRFPARNHLNADRIGCSAALGNTGFILIGAGLLAVALKALDYWLSATRPPKLH